MQQIASWTNQFLFDLTLQWSAPRAKCKWQPAEAIPLQWAKRSQITICRKLKNPEPMWDGFACGLLSSMCYVAHCARTPVSVYAFLLPANKVLVFMCCPWHWHWLPVSRPAVRANSLTLLLPSFQSLSTSAQTALTRVIIQVHSLGLTSTWSGLVGLGHNNGCSGISGS